MNTTHPEMAMDPSEIIKYDDRFGKATFVVKATAFERRCLSESHTDALRRNILEWSEGEPTAYTIGHFAGQPINVLFQFEMLLGRMVMFYECKSRICDNELIDAWLMNNCPAYANGNRTDATQFHKCIMHITNGKGLYV